MSRGFWRAAVVLRLALLAAGWPLLAHAQACDHRPTQDHEAASGLVVCSVTPLLPR
jgi:hypothetical protein